MIVSLGYHVLTSLALARVHNAEHDAQNDESEEYNSDANADPKYALILKYGEQGFIFRLYGNLYRNLNLFDDLYFNLFYDLFYFNNRGDAVLLECALCGVIAVENCFALFVNAVNKAVVGLFAVILDKYVIFGLVNSELAENISVGNFVRSDIGYDKS